MAAQDSRVQTTEETGASPEALTASGLRDALPERSLRLNEIIDLFSKLVTTAAVILGGLWTYKLFVEHREAYARANLQHDIIIIDIDDERRLLRLDVTIENTGNIMLSLRSAEVRIEAVLPLSDRIERTLDGTMNQIVSEDDSFPWPAIRVRHSEWEDGKFELEPGENDDTHYEFIIPANQDVINIYTHFDNPVKQDEQPGIGWDHSTLVDLRSLQDRGEMR
jgi:hypothetical protein